MSEFVPHSGEYVLDVEPKKRSTIKAAAASLAVISALAAPAVARAEKYNYTSPQAVKGKMAPQAPYVPPIEGTTFGISGSGELIDDVSPPNYPRNKAIGDIASLMANDDAQHATPDTTGRVAVRFPADRSKFVMFKPTSDCNPRDPAYNFRRIDNFVESMAKIHASVDLDIINTPSIYGPINMPLAPDVQANIDCALVKHLDGKHYGPRGEIVPEVVDFGEGNEVNMERNEDATEIFDVKANKSLFIQSDGIKMYDDGFIASVKEIKSKANPNATVSYGAFTDETGPGIIPMKTWLENANPEALKLADELDVHYYAQVEGDTPESGHAGEVVGDQDLSDTYFYNNHPDLVALVDSIRGDHDMEFDISETGVTSDQYAHNRKAQEIHQAVFLKQAMEFALRPLNRVRLLLNYGLLKDTHTFQTGIVEYAKYPNVLRTVHTLGYKVMARFIYRQKIGMTVLAHEEKSRQKDGDKS